MKTLMSALGLAATFALAPVAGPLWAQDDTAPAPAQTPAPGDSSVSFQTFYDQLASQGTWIQSDQYGYVFQPTENDPNWRPYTYGHWVNTDAGMTWVSNESFGWATDHYGRWVNLANEGWVWVPGYTWAPAWVSWRDNDDYVGWAPLPPDSDVGIDYYGNGVEVGFGFGFHIGDDCDTAYGIGAGCYNFCPVAYIGDQDCWRHFRDRRDNFAFINSTRNVTNINVGRDGAGRFGRVRAEGPSVAALNARAHHHIETARLAEVSGRNEAGLRGGTLGVFAPRVDRGTVRTARPGVVSGRLASTTVNRGTDIRHPLAVNSRVRPEAATATQVYAATVAQSHFTANERIATTSTRIGHPLTQPLTSMRTETRTATGDNREARVNSGVAQEPRTNPAESRFTGEPEQARTAAPATESRVAGESATRHATGESSFTGEPAATRAPETQSRFATEPATRHESRGEDSFTGEPARTQAVTHTAPAVQHKPAFASGEANHPATVYHPSTPAYHPAAAAPVFHSSEPVYHPQASAQTFHQSAPVYHPQASAPAFHQSAPSFHPSAQASHPQASFHSAAPQPHFNGGGGGVHASAPAAHAAPSGGGGHPSGGGGAHAAAGGAKH